MATEKQRGIPYSLGEAELAARQNQMDPYHREIIEWLIAQVREIAAVEREECAKLAKSMCVSADPLGGGYCDGPCGTGIAAAIRARV